MSRSLLPNLLRGGLLALVPVIAGIAGLNSLGSHHGDEAAYIEAAAHMLETGNYLVPVYHGQLVLDKAPLFYWAVALSFHLFGISLAAARLPSLLGAGLIAALVYWFTLTAYGSVRGAVYAVLAMASSIVTCWISRLAVPDTLMTCGVFLSLACYVRATTGGYRALNLFLASVGIGVAGMAKGHVGIVVALLPLVVLVALVDRRSPDALRLREVAAPWVWLPAVVLSGWWYVYLLTSQHRVVEFAPAHLIRDQTLSGALIQFMRGEVEHQVSGGWSGLIRNVSKYAVSSFVWFFPWLLCVLAGLVVPPRAFRLDWREKRPETAAMLTLIVSLMLLFTFVILERNSARYLLPIGPAVGILAGRFFVRREQWRGRTRRIPAPAIVGVGLLVLYAVFFGVLLPKAVSPPVESLCAMLKPRLRAGDVVLAAGIADKWSTFAMAMLGRPVQWFTNRNPQALVEQIEQQVRADPSRTGGAFYVLTNAQAAQVFQKQPQFSLLSEGVSGWFAEERQFWEKIVLFEVVRPAA